MFKFGKPCSFCMKDTKYAAMVDGEMLYFCKRGGCKERFLDIKELADSNVEAFKEAFVPYLIAKNSIVFKGFKVSEIRHAYGDKYAVNVKSEDTGMCTFYLSREQAKDFNLDEEFEITLTKKVK